MRKFGLIGGLSWHSTARYYKLINEGVARAKGGLNSAPLLIESLNFADVAQCVSENDWDCAAPTLIDAARRLEAGGARGIAICANSMHAIYDRVQDAVSVPVLHIADEVGRRLKQNGVRTAALLGTSNVMTGKYYRQRLVSQGLSLLPADPDMINRMDEIIYNELMVGKARRESERFMKSELTDIAKQDVQAAILACTELEAIVDVQANVLPIYDSTAIHAGAILDFILND